MFGQNNNQDAAKIPEQSIDAALNDQAAPANDWQHPGTPISDSAAAPATDTADTPTEATAAPEIVTPAAAPVLATDEVSNDLIDIKQKALNQLAPLVGHLDQSPEERFRTTMMMIQASDNQALIKDAYTAAQAITDEKTRAQALLDIVNEINYFTQHTE